MFACAYSSIEIIKLIIEKGANVKFQNEEGNTALHIASRYAKIDGIDKIKLLLDNGADINAKDTQGHTPLMVAAYFSNTTSSLEVVKFLIDNGANLYDKNVANKTAIEFCSTNECKDYISSLIWNQLYNRDMELANKYSKSGDIKLPKDIWEIILLNKRQQLICSSLSTSKNKEILVLFAIELKIPVTKNMTKGQLCGLISRQLSYGKYYNKNISNEIDKYKTQILEIAQKFNIDSSKPINEIIKELSNIF